MTQARLHDRRTQVLISSNQSILKEISLGCSLEGMMLKLKLQYFGYLMRRVDSLEKTLILQTYPLIRASLLAQWLTIHLPMQETRV